MKYLLIALNLLFVIPTNADMTQELQAYISDYLELYPNRQKEAMTYIPTIIVECEDKIDPLLIAVMISRESSWDYKAQGKLGEVGLLQIMPRYAKGFDLADPHEQIRAGVRHLKRALTMCHGHIKDALNAMGCGKCGPHKPFLAWRWHEYERAIRRYRKHEN